MTDALRKPRNATVPPSCSSVQIGQLLPPPDPETCWQAVIARDHTADGLFFFCVATTGIYCRPSCSARQPKRQNVSFYRTAQEAEANGYRACKRCKPKDSIAAALQPNALRVTEACRLIADAEEPPRLGEIADFVGLSPAHFHRIFRQAIGMTPRQYAAHVRAARVRDALASSATVTKAIHEAGYSSNSRFYDEAQAVLGMTAASYRKGGAGERIRHLTAPCTLGHVLVAASDAGICAVLLGDDVEALEKDLACRFPNAQLDAGDGAMGRVVADVVAQIEGPSASADTLPLDLRGTAFQHRVWHALRQIPVGETCSYGELARAIDAPSSVRAVARACGANPVAVVVPCHRVVGADGGITGYRWGVERKRRLLEKESRQKHAKS